MILTTRRTRHFAVSLTVLWFSFLLAACAQASDRFSMDDYDTVEKIDVHFHVHTENTDFVAFARRDRFRLLNMAVQTGGAEVMEQKHRTTFFQYRANPDRIAPVSSFPMAGWDEPDWQEKTIRHLDQTIAQGAVGVKVWKNIGMVFRDTHGKLVMIDDPKFDSIFAHLKQRGVVLIGHLGEPKNCWLPLDQMTVNNDRSYFKEHPQYHMNLHPEMPSYQEQIDARDRMLAKNPSLPFVGAHFASIEWSVDELAKFLDRFPNAVVDTAARIGQLQYQSQRDRAKVIAFLNKYQNRILYGTDTGIGPNDRADVLHRQARTKWLADWKYFNTDETITVPELDEPVQGLALTRDVVEKIYRVNAQRVFATSWQQHAPRSSDRR